MSDEVIAKIVIILLSIAVGVILYMVILLINMQKEIEFLLEEAEKSATPEQGLGEIEKKI